MVRAGVWVWADLAWVALASESERVLDFVEHSSHRNIQRPTSKIQRQTSHQPSTIYSLQPFAVNLVNSSVAADKFLVLLIIENTQAGRPLQFPRRIRMVGVVGEIVFDSIAGTRRLSRINEHGMIDRKPWITRQITDEKISTIQRGIEIGVRLFLIFLPS